MPPPLSSPTHARPHPLRATPACIIHYAARVFMAEAASGGQHLLTRGQLFTAGCADHCIEPRASDNADRCCDRSAHFCHRSVVIALPVCHSHRRPPRERSSCGGGDYDYDDARWVLGDALGRLFSGNVGGRVIVVGSWSRKVCGGFYWSRVACAWVKECAGGRGSELRAVVSLACVRVHARTCTTARVGARACLVYVRRCRL